ncbi:MAG: flagellar biosynthesis protein FlhA [Actinobacteria bacterium]|nr:flagellar biosynthesis protein FlhA [Actinomycetota bacterium]
MLVIPIPTFVLDLLISLNITAALVIMLMTMNVKRPLDFSVFPSILLLATLFRLAINVAVTRLVLLHAYAGQVIQAFGTFVVGSNLVIGLVVFLVLIIIQFVVVTSGAGRVAEVTARFTLDAMPGKQMAIDADLNAGLIDQEEALRRRREISEQADFYGSMDGASKFVRGDATAALVIVAINLIGGLIVGVVERHMPVSQAVHTYSLLSVGDGLVSQIPALLLSVSTGLIVTRASTKDDDFGSDVLLQIQKQHRAIRIAGIVLAGIGLIPGLPHVPFVAVGLVVWFMGRRAGRAFEEVQASEAEPEEAGTAIDTPQSIAAELRVEPLELELAVNLIDLVDSAHGGDLLERVRALRKKLAMDTGLIIPPVRTRDNLELSPDTYVVKVHGVEVAQGLAPPGKVMAIGDGLPALPGDITTEPVFGLPAKWVPAELRQQALVGGATVIDRSSVITTHLGELAARFASRLLSTQQVKFLLDLLRTTDPAIVEEMSSAQVTLIDLQRTLSGLLEESVPIRNLARIVEAITERARRGKDSEGLIEAARVALGPAITAGHAVDGVLTVITLDPSLERALVDSVRTSDEGSVLAIDPGVAEQLVAEVRSVNEAAEQQGKEPVLICATHLRPALRKLLQAAVPQLAILSIAEVGPQVRLERIGVVNVVNTASAV